MKWNSYYTEKVFNGVNIADSSQLTVYKEPEISYTLSGEDGRSEAGREIRFFVCLPVFIILGPKLQSLNRISFDSYVC